jgi:hypothetical protein
MKKYSNIEVTGSINITGSLIVDGIVSFSGSVIDNALSSSFAETASLANQAISSSFAATASLANQATSASYSATASIADTAVTASYALTASIANQATSASYSATASIADTSISASYSATASIAEQATSASYSLTSSYINALNQDVSITGSVEIFGTLNVVGNASFISVTASNVIVDQNTITVFGSGSVLPLAGYIAADTASVYPSGTFLYNLPTGEWESNSPISASLIGTASYALTASYSLNGGGGGASVIISASAPVSESKGTLWFNTDTVTGDGGELYILLDDTSSNWIPVVDNFVDQAVSASYALTASYALNGGGGGASVLVSESAPVSQSAGTLWFNTDTDSANGGELFIQLSDSGSTWIPVVDKNVDQAVSSSYALTASFAVSSSYSLSSNQAVSSSYSETASFAVSSSFAPTNITYELQTLDSVSNIGGTLTDVATFTLPVPGVYKIFFTIRCIASSNISEPKFYLRRSDNTEIAQSMLMPSYGLANLQAYGSQISIVTTTVNNQGMKLTAICGNTGTMNLASDGNGFSKIMWEKIA